VCLAIPGKILEISSGNQRAAPVDVAGVRRRVDLALVEDDAPRADGLFGGIVRRVLQP